MVLLPRSDYKHVYELYERRSASGKQLLKLELQMSIVSTGLVWLPSNGAMVASSRPDGSGTRLSPKRHFIGRFKERYPALWKLVLSMSIRNLLKHSSYSNLLHYPISLEVSFEATRHRPVLACLYSILLYMLQTMLPLSGAFLEVNRHNYAHACPQTRPTKYPSDLVYIRVLRSRC